MPDASPPLVVALSGPTSSGKTTVAAVLKFVLPHAFILHADDFYKPDSLIPLHPSGIQDWDCADALDLPKFRQTLLDVKHGKPLPDGFTKQGGVDDGVHGPSSAISQQYLEKLWREVDSWPAAVKTRKLVLVEGFLLFGVGVRDTLAELFDLKILLRSTKAAAEKRRKNRNGYVTLEGFWQDPEGYFEDVVWPNYVRDQGFLFEDGDVEGIAKDGDEDEIMVGPIDDEGLEDLCEWVFRCLRKGLEGD